MNAGRKSAYDTTIKPKFKKIKKLISKGATEKSVAKQIGVAYSTWNKYKAEKKEFAELLKNNREVCIDDIENSMFESALGGIKTLKKAMKCKHIDYENGKRVREYEDVVHYDEQIYIPPNTTSGIYLLKHWGKSRGYTNDPKSLELKQKEYELKKETLENNNW